VANLGQRPRIRLVSAKGAIHREPGAAPQDWWNKKPPALKARFTSHIISIIIGAMPQSLSKVILHIVFSTKNHEPWLDSSVGPRMHTYLATVCRDLGAELVRVGAVLLITFTLSRRCRELFPKLSSLNRSRKHPRNGSKRLMLVIAVFSGNAGMARFR
jgi:hypothetical protein